MVGSSGSHITAPRLTLLPELQRDGFAATRVREHALSLMKDQVAGCTINGALRRPQIPSRSRRFKRARSCRPFVTTSAS